MAPPRNAGVLSPSSPAPRPQWPALSFVSSWGCSLDHRRNSARPRENDERMALSLWWSLSKVSCRCNTRRCIIPSFVDFANRCTKFRRVIFFILNFSILDFFFNFWILIFYSQFLSITILFRNISQSTFFFMLNFSFLTFISLLFLNFSQLQFYFPKKIFFFYFSLLLSVSFSLFTWLSKICSLSLSLSSHSMFSRRSIAFLAALLA